MTNEKIVEKYFLSAYDLERIEAGETIEIITRDNKVVELSLWEEEDLLEDLDSMMALEMMEPIDPTPTGEQSAYIAECQYEDYDEEN